MNPVKHLQYVAALTFGFWAFNTCTDDANHLNDIKMTEVKITIKLKLFVALCQKGKRRNSQLNPHVKVVKGESSQFTRRNIYIY